MELAISIIIVFIISIPLGILWVNGIDYMDKNYPDYKGEDLTEDSILNLLRGRYADYFPSSKKLITNSESRIFLYFNGHGGENFFKIQDTELIHSEDLGKTFNEMY